MVARSDLSARRQRAAARVLLRGLGAYERSKDRFLVGVPTPGDDPFHAASPDLETRRPGDVVAARPVTIRALRRALRVRAWQVSFRSTDRTGAPILGITTVIVPRRRGAGSTRPLLAYQCAIDALGFGSDPSYTLRRGDQVELPFLALALRRGWTVVATDYNGPRHAFGALPLVGRLVLDGIRAATGFEPAGLGAATPIGLWGYSGGGLATLAAIERQPSYAPELRIVGAAAGGAGVDVTSSPHMFEVGNLLSGIPFGAIIGIARGTPEVDLHAVLTPDGETMVAAAAAMTMEQLVASFPFVRWSDLLTVPSVFDVPGMRAALAANRMGQGPPMAPVHLYHAVHDKYPAIADVDALVQTYRRAGVDVTYRRFPLGGHLTVAFAGAPGALRFLRQRFAAVRPADGGSCDRR